MSLRLLVAWCAGIFLCVADRFLIPREIGINPWFNLIPHFWGGVVSAWIAMENFKSINVPRRFHILKRILVLGAIWGIFLTLSTFYEFSLYLQNFRLSREQHMVLYDNLIENIKLFSLGGIFAGIITAAFVRITHIDFWMEGRWFFFMYLGTAAFLSGAHWELLEFWRSGARELQYATTLTLYSDTIKDLCMDGVGGILFTIKFYPSTRKARGLSPRNESKCPERVVPSRRAPH